MHIAAIARHLPLLVRLLPSALALTGILVCSTAARAAFPGDNGKLAFSSNGYNNVYTVDPDGSGLTQLTFGGGLEHNEFPAWSPNGAKIAFSSTRDSNYEIYVMNADGSAQQRITSNPATDTQPAWSPDGHRIAFITNRDGNYELYVVNADGTGPTRLTNTPSSESAPAWSPDGTRIALESGVHTSDRGPRIDVIAPDGTNRASLSDGYVPNWSPDGCEVWSSWYYYDSINEYTISFLQSSGFGSCGYGDAYDDPQDVTHPVVAPDNTEIAFTYTSLYRIGFRNRNGFQRYIDVPAAGHVDWQPIIRGYPRPKGASPMRLPLVPSETTCTAPNNSHGAPLSYGSCSPPSPTSSKLAVSFGELKTKSLGSVKLVVNPGTNTNPDDADVNVSLSITNVMNRSDQSDYTGELRLELPLRITDHANTPAPVGGYAGTVSDTSLFAAVPCTATADTTLGSTCALSTTVDSIVPSTVHEGLRAIWALGQVKVWDGGADGDADTAGDNRLFEVQGIFTP
jgi:TolB protein